MAAIRLAAAAAGILIVLWLAQACKRSEPADDAPRATTTTTTTTGADQAQPTPSAATADEVASYTPSKPATGRFHDVHGHFNAIGALVALELLEAHGVSRVVNLSGGSPGRPTYDESLRLIEYTGGRVVPFFNIDWRRLESDGDDFGKNIAADLQAAVEAGFGGLKIAKSLGLSVERPDGTLMPIDDPLLDPIFEKAGELGIPVAIHSADPKAFFEPATPQNERWEELSAHPSWSFHGDAYPEFDELLAQLERRIARHPHTTFICVHFGNNAEDPDYVERLLRTWPNAHIDLSARLGELGRHPAERMRQLFIEHQDRILFGTDFMLYAQQVEGERSVRISMILGSSGPEDEPAPTVDDAHRFFDSHWRFLESDAPNMPNPVPIQGRWDIHPLSLPPEVLEKVYLTNAERLIFAPWDARHASAP